MKYFIPFFILFLACNSSKEVVNTPDSNLYQSWRHSHEEDGTDFKVYRTTDFNFPPSRGRDGFEIKENGDFIHYQIAPTDGTLEVNGKWVLEAENNMKVTPNSSDHPSFNMEIVELSAELLKIKK